ncbi:hypothetical protein E2320_012890, partial [Naja naja]
MSLLNYSEDTFTSMTEEEENGRQYEDDSFESYDSADELEEPSASDLTEGAWQSSCQKDEELLDSAFVGESLTRKWISLLKGNRTIAERAKPSTESDTGNFWKRTGVLQSFCASKINHLHHQRVSEPLRRNSRKEQRPGMVSRRQQMGGVVPSELKRAELAKVEFLRRKKTILDNILLQEKLEDYMYTKDSLTLIGEIYKDLPKLSEDPSNIWQELNKR